MSDTPTPAANKALWLTENFGSSVITSSLQGGGFISRFAEPVLIADMVGGSIASRYLTAEGEDFDQSIANLFERIIHHRPEEHIVIASQKRRVVVDENYTLQPWTPPSR